MDEVERLLFQWEQVEGPAVDLTDANTLTACFVPTQTGEYRFRFQVIWPEGEFNCEEMTSQWDSIVVTVVEANCATGLDVTVIDAGTRDPMVGATVDVVENGGTSYSSVTDASGLATFDGLDGTVQRSVTASSADMVPPLPLTGADRPKYEITTVLEQCGSEITIPVKRTASGEAALPVGTVTAKVPQTVFNMLPHSNQCAGDCQNNAACNSGYYCELDPTQPCGPSPMDPGVGHCTPTSLLPMFNLGSSFVSGQFRMIMLVPVWNQQNQTYRDVNTVFAPPPNPMAIFPGNMTTDDLFLNGLAQSLGLDPWGDFCVRTADCPNPNDYVCEQDPQGDYRCKDKNSMRNLRMTVPAGSGVQLALVAGIVDVSMTELLPVLLPLLTGNASIDIMELVGTFDFQTLHVCPVMVDVPAGGEKDISADLVPVSPNSCWNIDYQAIEGYVGLPNPGVAPAACSTDDDCCDGAGNCGWPDSGMMCLEDQQKPGTTACQMPMFRVQIQTNDEVEVLPDFTGFDPTAMDADARIQAGLPATAPYEELCPTGTPGINQSCVPPRMHDMPVPGDTECSLPFGLVLAAMDHPVGRVFIGFDFISRKNYTGSSSKFLVPRSIMTGGVYLAVTQMFVRNIMRTDRGDLWEIPGSSQSADRWDVLPVPPRLPSMLPLPGLAPPPVDAALSAEITFIAEDPTIWPDPVIQSVYATAIGPRMPQAGTHDMTYELTELNLAGQDLRGVVLSKIDYAAAITYVDPWWRVYVPATAASVTLPESLSPFSSGDHVWVTPFGAGFGQPFDYDLFPTDILLGPMSQYSEDSWAVIVP